MFFDGRLAGCEHEMIHAFVFVATPMRDHDDHGPLFQAHMQRINLAASTQITVFHTFHDEVDSYRQHIWLCDVSSACVSAAFVGEDWADHVTVFFSVLNQGPCRRSPPYFGQVKRSMNRAPGPTDRWWTDHQRNCGGSYAKIKEPAEYTAKQAKKKQRQLEREEKQRQKDKEAKAAPSVKQFLVTTAEVAKAETSSTKPPAPIPKPQLTGKSDNGGANKKRKQEDDSRLDAGWPAWALPSSASVIFSSDAEGDGDFYLVGDVRALFQVPRAGGTTSGSGSGAVVDLTVSDNDDGDDEEEDKAPTTSAMRSTAETTTEHSPPARREADVIEID
ncbi:hypothetical protein BBJ28_00005787 [Nothophytophthora sp. Chile5]|nr:hypothetical protein BBJ28_00005787 [Nothophytophthora sp. Chile5]